MKKLVLVCLMLFIASSAYAVMRNAPVTYNAGVDGVLITGDCVLVDANVYYTGATVGNKLELREGVTSSGAIFATIVADTVNGNKRITPIEPFIVDGGIYADATLSGGAMGINIICNQ